ncbi:hypothetical protein [Shouchella hunanensis]|uniref:PD(D/E)XK endonuclease domain-containing protein n=1 Tax=Shouchella hunanensis TaxID=766894 RepID=A0ABY7W529_9BACI|nr:hypothetical protein [Shouchella hunanensis]WDF02967.1 hypothetical protein PQ477_15890 [Shouchella hunanensis]
MNSHQCGVAAESFTATMFAWAGYDVSVQYGANQPEYDLVIVKGDKMLKISVKGSNVGRWVLTASLKKDETISYADAIDTWRSKHSTKTVFSLVQFKNADMSNAEMPRIYLATVDEIARELNLIRNGTGYTALYENNTYKSGTYKGLCDKVPDEWIFSKERVNYLIDLFN